MAIQEMTINEIRERGCAVLVRELGPVGYVRFIQQFRAGQGDYTAERSKLHRSLTGEKLREMIEERRRSRLTPPRKGSRKRRKDG